MIDDDIKQELHSIVDKNLFHQYKSLLLKLKKLKHEGLGNKEEADLIREHLWDLWADLTLNEQNEIYQWNMNDEK